MAEGHAYKEWLTEQGHSLEDVMKDAPSIPPELHQTTWCANEAISFLNEDREGPWLMSVNMFDPHAPVDPPTVYAERYDSREMPGPLFRQSDLENQAKLAGVDFQNKGQTPEEMEAHDKQVKYYAMIELIDHNVGRMLDALEESGQAEDTLVIFMSDHGETLGDHGLILKGCRFYEGLVRVPLIVAGAGVGVSGQTCDGLVELTDIAPTLLDLAGLEIPSASRDARCFTCSMTRRSHIGIRSGANTIVPFLPTKEGLSAHTRICIGIRNTRSVSITVRTLESCMI
jgi:arylsulfatase